MHFGGGLQDGAVRSGTLKAKSRSRCSEDTEKQPAGNTKGGAPQPPPAPDGRTCKLCLQADNSKDPVDPKAYRAWAYPPKEKGLTQGHYCYYCNRTWLAMYKHKMNVTALCAQLGADEAERKKFHKFLEMMIGHCKEASRLQYHPQLANAYQRTPR